MAEVEIVTYVTCFQQCYMRIQHYWKCSFSNVGTCSFNSGGVTMCSSQGLCTSQCKSPPPPGRGLAGHSEVIGKAFSFIEHPRGAT